MSQLISQSQLDRSKKEEKFVLLTAEQVRKDFAMFGMEVQFSGNVNFAYNELFPLAVPSEYPLQLISVSILFRTNKGGSIISTVAHTDTPNESVTVTVYTPDGRSIILFNVSDAPVLH